jgi:hypothetical protein
MDNSKKTLLEKLQQGASFVKFNDDGSRTERFFYVCPKLDTLCYNVSKRSFEISKKECNIITLEISSR